MAECSENLLKISIIFEASGSILLEVKYYKVSFTRNIFDLRVLKDSNRAFFYFIMQVAI